MGDAQIQWHPGFVAAMNLEMAESRGNLRFEKEYNLNVKPLEIDLLITKESVDTPIENEIGRIFKGHNILEYKNSTDQLDIDVFYKVEGYACLYKAYGETVDFIKEDDVTITFIREAKPTGLFRYFSGHGYQVSNPYPGIYYITGRVLFPAQIVVTKELDPQSHVWLRALSGKLEKQDMWNLLECIGQLEGKRDKELGDAVLEVAMRANERIVKELIGDGNMSEALMEIMKPIIEPMLQQKERQAIQSVVNALRDYGLSGDKIKENIMKNFGLTSEDAEQYL